MSNRYIDFAAMLGNTTQHARYLQRPTNEREEARKNKIKDISENPKKIWGNNAFRYRVKQMQEAMNYRNEIDRLKSMIHDGRIPANRRELYRGRLTLLEQKLIYLKPLITEHGEYQHVG